MLFSSSARNVSEKPRWSMICCYNARSNDPYKEAHHPRYTPLKKVPDAAIKKVGLKRFADDESNVAWLDAKKDASARRTVSSNGSRPTFTPGGVRYQ